MQKAIRGGINLYAYVGNDPLNLVDPNGEFANLLIGALIGGGIDLGIQLIANGGNLSDVSWTSVGISAALGTVGNIGGGRAASAFINSASTGTKEIVGEIGAVVKGLAEGRVPIASQMEYGLSRGYTRVDQIQASILNGNTVLVEAKYSTSGYPSVSRAQRLAQTELPQLGLDYRIITTVPGEVEAAGRIAGSIGGAAVGSSVTAAGLGK